jgi:hypothetical protein
VRLQQQRLYDGMITRNSTCTDSSSGSSAVATAAAVAAAAAAVIIPLYLQQC